MEEIYIPRSGLTPEVRFNADAGILLLEGKSLPENAKKFYQPLIEWVVDYAKNPAEKTVVDMKLVFFSTNSSKYLLLFFRELEKIILNGHSVSVNWYYNEIDEEMLESGEDFDILVKLPFEFHTL